MLVMINIMTLMTNAITNMTKISIMNDVTMIIKIMIRNLVKVKAAAVGTGAAGAAGAAGLAKHEHDKHKDNRNQHDHGRRDDRNNNRDDRNYDRRNDNRDNKKKVE